MDNAYVFIMAGGKGERFWPLSNSAHPKQTLSIFTGKPLIASSVDRATALVPPERVFIITNESLVGLMQELLPEIPAENIVGEPMGRDTAAACALASGIALSRNPEAVCTILTADHIIGKRDLFCETIRESVALAEREDAILTIGIQPSFPSTGFGYIETSEERETKGNVAFLKADRFVEKPDESTAAEYIESGKYFWNSGMFVWKAANFAERLARLAPPLHDLTDRVANATDLNTDLEPIMKEIYPSLERISVDYAVMEHEKNMVMAKSPFDWSDVGSWSAMSDHFPPDPSSNIMLGDVCQIESSNNIVVSEKGMTALMGVKDMVVVSDRDVTLVCHKSQVERIKELVKLVGCQPDFEEYV